MKNLQETKIALITKFKKFLQSSKTVTKTKFTQSIKPAYGRAFTLAEGATHVDMPKGQLKPAFTLAEVLITLGVIGVVAALTLPILIQKYNEKVWVTSYLRVYSLLENAYKRVQEENGTFENWSGATIYISNETTGEVDTTKSDGMHIYNTMVKPYMQVNTAYLSGTVNCMPKETYLLDGRIWLDSFGTSHWLVPSVSLVSGECMALGYNLGDFVVDVNGKKKPNTLGKDIFVFSFDINKHERIKPGYYQRTWTDMPDYCDKKSSTAWSNGISCGFWIVRNHNMDYLHMPFGELKAKWKGRKW